MSSPNPTQLWQQLTNSSLLRFLLFFACGWAIVQVIGFFYSTIAIFTAAGIFAALLNYPVQWLQRRMPRGLAIAVSFLGSLAILGALVTVLGLEVINQGQSLVTRLGEAIQQQDFLPLKDLVNQLNLDKLIATLQTGLLSGLGIVQNLFSSVFILIFTAVISLYMLIDGEKIWRACLKLIPQGSRDRFASTFQRSFLGFLRGQLLLMLFLATATFVVFSLLGVRYAVILAIIVGVLDAIPGIGATLGVLVVTTLILAAQGWQMALTVVIASVILQQIQDNYVHPKVMGNALEMNPVLLFFALFIGERIAGLLGVFLSIPIAGMIVAWMRAEEALQEQAALAAGPEVPMADGGAIATEEAPPSSPTDDA